MANITEEGLRKYYQTSSLHNMPDVSDDHFTIKGKLCDTYKDRIETLHKTDKPMATEDTLRPAYYGGMHNTYEVFNVLEAWGLDKDFYLGNVIKYVSRAGKKNKSTEREDLLKAVVYLQKRIDSL